MTETQRFNAADPYAPLGTKGTTDGQLLGLLMEQASPHLPSRVLGEHERGQRIQEIISVVEYLRSRYVRILNENGLSDLELTVGDRRRRFMSSTDICRSIPDQSVRNEIRNLLAQERKLLTAELLERLGFLPSDIFTRDDTSDDKAESDDETRRRETEARFKLLCELLVEANFQVDVFDEPERVIETIGVMQVRNYPENARLARWVSDANVDFDECIHDAFKYLEKLFKSAAPTGPAGQAYEQISNLGSKSFIELILIILNKKLPIRTRFESMRLLEWAIALFSLRRNPVFQAQRDVRACINEILEENIWDGGVEKLPVEIKPELLEFIGGGEPTLGTPVQEEKPVIMRARKVCDEVAKIMRESGVVDEDSEDRLIFGGREKSEYSIARKIFLLQLFAQKCQATLEGRETGMSKTEARKRLRKWRGVLRRQGKDADSIRLKPIGFDTLDDNVGYSMSVSLKKPLDKYGRKGRRQITKMFREVCKYIAGAVGLQKPVYENHLWEVNPENQKSVHGFRVFKVAGEYPVTKEVFVNGRSKKEVIMVPVEIQLLPVETLLRKKLPGDVSDNEYERRKAIELAQRLHPPKIAGVEVYPEVFDVGRFAKALNRTADDDDDSMQAYE